jgi:hypothetical protein
LSPEKQTHLSVGVEKIWCPGKQRYSKCQKDSICGAVFETEGRRDGPKAADGS